MHIRNMFIVDDLENVHVFKTLKITSNFNHRKPLITFGDFLFNYLYIYI